MMRKEVVWKPNRNMRYLAKYQIKIWRRQRRALRMQVEEP
jgi:hypothetical protein